MQFKLSFTASL